MEFVEHGLLVDAFAGEAGRVEHLSEIAVPIATGRADRAREGAGRAAVQAGVAYDRKPRHDGANFRIIPAVVVERVQAELAVDERDRGQKVEAVIGRLARLRIDPTGIVLLPL